ncbi:MAG: hypothetical protein K2G02_03710 [Phocaeicola sp.]|uniref:hypothetical protein n=1 Tax=Phocaeicola sp. TaxID=2773926 RepID=UPI0023BB2562|nr:hypothetical protein [Phocaeicola sp.]MDE5677802.1 hypothetical protein [Phocaeicola sp.]MDE6180224.1 hypothetical protein [Phocaeicola sp.]
MAKLSYKVSYYALYVMMALIIVVLAMFFGVGYTNPVGEYNAPEHTETLIYFMYLMFGICVAVTIIGALAQFVSGLKDNPKGAMKSLLGLILFVAVLIVAYAMSSDAPLQMASGEIFTDAMLLKLSDMMIYSIYALASIATIATVLNLTGIFRK